VTLTEADRVSYSDSTQPPYKFTAGLLTSLFASTVSNWFEVERLGAAHKSAVVFAEKDLYGCGVQVSTRFIATLRTPFPEAAFRAALAEGITNSIGIFVSPDEFFDFSVCV
jgi:hypothetical protein